MNSFTERVTYWFKEDNYLKGEVQERIKEVKEMYPEKETCPEIDWVLALSIELHLLSVSYVKMYVTSNNGMGQDLLLLSLQEVDWVKIARSYLNVK